MTSELIGLFPAAGKATRLGQLPCSKEIYPLVSPQGSTVVGAHLLRSYQAAGIQQVHTIIRPEKWDIPRYLGSGEALDLHIAYHVIEGSLGTPYTLDHVYPFIQGKQVALGFPDILFQPSDCFKTLHHTLNQQPWDIVLGLFPAPNPTKMDMVKTDGDGNVTRIDIKPNETNLTKTWIAAAWKPSFTDFMHHYLQQQHDHYAQNDISEPYVGTVIIAAMAAGLKVGSYRFPKGQVLDVGTLDDLTTAQDFLNQIS